MTSMIIKTKRFTLRPFRKGDERSHQKNINDKAIYKYTLRIPYPYTMQHAKKWVKLNLSPSKKQCRLVIDIEDEAAGSVSIENMDGFKGEIGYWLAKKYWNKGIVTQAAGIMAKIGFKKLKLKRIYANIHHNNKSSARVLEKNGFLKEGLLKKAGLKKGKVFDVFMYAKVK